MNQIKISAQITNRDSNALKRYLSEVSRLDNVLTIEEEAALAERVVKGSEKAAKELIERNLRFVISVAKQYQSSNLELSDLISEGNYGLIIAAKKFDPTKGFKFISYAVWWIRQSIMLYISSNSKKIRVPMNRAGELSRIRKVKNQLVQELERDPTENEIIDRLNVSYKNNYSIEKLKANLSAEISVSSFDRPIQSNSEDGMSMLDILESDNNTFSYTEKSDRVKIIKKHLSVLDSRAKKIVTEFYGLYNNDPKTIDSIAYELNLTRERTRQIYKSAIKQMRMNAKNTLIR